MKRLSVAFLWHLHQPQYRLRGEAVCPLPWVRLHAIRAYYDMVRVLDEFPDIRVTVNLVPCLLEQIRSYEQGGSDLFLEMGTVPAEDLDETQKAFLFDRFFSAGEARMIGSLPAYMELLRRRNQARKVHGRRDAWKEFSTGDYRDLQALFELAWFGFKAREDFPEIRVLRSQGRGFTRDDIERIHRVEREILARIIPLYRRAASSGRLEISCSPYAHPILPLLCDTDAAKEALPDLPLPERWRAPEDAEAQVEDARDRMEREIGLRPPGMWPSEGSVSGETAAILARCGVKWAASDEQVLGASAREGNPDASMPWNLAEAPGLDLVFRDHDLSDRVGFTYSGMSAGEAVGNLLGTLRQRAEARPDDPGFVLLALDGENPWENYADAGADFLRTLYGAIVGNARIQCASVGAAIEASPRRGKLHRLRAGSWIGANFGIWIGGPEKNRAWDLLGRARSELAPALADASVLEAKREAAWASLRAAEGSDWFWWLDGQFHSIYRAEFDQIFRGHLQKAYEALGKAAPAHLDRPIPAVAEQAAEAAPIEPPVWLAPDIDGYESHFFEWEGAVRIEWDALVRRSTMERSRAWFDTLEFGFMEDGEFVLRMDPPYREGLGPFRGVALDLVFRTAEEPRHVSVMLDEEGNLREARRWRRSSEDNVVTPEASGARAALRKILELSVPAEETGFTPGQRASFQIKLKKGGDEVALDELDILVPTLEGSSRAWSA